jgi:lysophospholipase L1-like esterase
VTEKESPTLSSTQGALLQIAAALVLTVVLLAGIELLSGLFVARRAQTELAQNFPEDPVSKALTWLAINPAPLIKDVDLLWRNEPLARKTLEVNPRAFGRSESWTIENNSEGFRGAERTQAGDDTEIYRVLCVGDSVTFAFNTDQDAAYPRRLEQHLREQYPARRFEVVNAGVSGWSWIQGLRFLETRGFALHPDAIVIAHGTNDQFLMARVTDEERFHRLATPLKRFVQSAGLLLSRTNTYRAVEWLLPRREPTGNSLGCQKQIARTGYCRRVSLEEIEAAVREIGRLAARHGTDLLVLNLDFVKTPAVEAVRRAVAREGIPFLDLVDRLNALREAEEDARAARLGLAPARETPRADARPTNEVVLRVLVPRGLETYSVEGARQFFSTGFAFNGPMYDDGTHGDEVAADGVFSTTVSVPVEVKAISYKFFQNAVAEFVSLPPLPSTQGERSMRLSGDRIAPVVVFGEHRFMAEGAHPNADGHAIIAEAVAHGLETLPSFQRLKGTGSAARDSTETP